MSDSISRSLMGAVSSALILSVLKEGDSYGYAISKIVRDVSEGKINWREGSLYPVLKRLEQDGLISSAWKTEGSRPRLYYSIEEKGIQFLSKNMEQLQLIIGMLNKLNKRL